MPHIVIKTISGPTHAQLQEAAEQIAAVVNKTMGKPEKYISVSVEEYAFSEWEYVKNKENVLVKPGYSDPKTFESDFSSTESWQGAGAYASGPLLFLCAKKRVRLLCCSHV